MKSKNIPAILPVRHPFFFGELYVLKIGDILGQYCTLARHYKNGAVLSCLLMVFSSSGLAAIEESDLMNSFIDKMVSQHQFAKSELKKLFKSVEIKQNILKAISRPAESMPWYKYRKIFITESRINGGVRFWRENEALLARVEQQYGVPAEIITAIIGVETRYGGNTGSYRVIDALSTLAFAYPKRSEFFLSELENFLLLAREEHMNSLDPLGSYAGAMGVPQFMPSSYRHYAVDFDRDKKRDIWSNNADVIASVANYFAEHQWRKGAFIAFPVSAEGEDYKQALTTGLKPDVMVEKLQQIHISVPGQLKNKDKVKLLSFEQPNREDLWVGMHNFYVITRYNHSPLYAMAVFQLSQAIVDTKNADNEK